MREELLEGYRLSPQQKHLWALLPGGPYQTKCVVAIKGHFDVCHLKAAAQRILERHEILRTTFQSLPGMTIPMQVIKKTGDILWQEDDISGSDSQAPLIEAFFQAAFPSFDLERGPTLHLHLIKQAEDDYVMILRLPAICADSVSLRNLVGELSRAYAAVAHGEQLDGDVIQYADLAEWQNELIEAERTRFGREYWRDRYLPRLPGLRLAFEGDSTGDGAFEPRLDELVIAPLLADRIESLARSAETSLERILLACWHILLWRHTGQSEVEIATAFDGRRAVEIEGALGLFARYLPITCHLEEFLQLSDILEQLDESFLTVRDRQEYFSWEYLIERSDHRQGAPFFPFCFEPEIAPASFSAGSASFTVFKQYACIDCFKIKLSYARRPDGLIVALHYNSESFRRDDIRSLMGHFEALLENVIANPLAKVGELEMITDAERQQLFAESNLTKTEWPQDRFVHELFLEQVERTPEAVAVIYEDEWLTYRELNERSARLSSYLRQQGVRPEVVVGLSMERSLELVVSLLAVLKAGGAYLPLDPSYPPARLLFMIEDAAVAMVLTQAHLSSRLPLRERAPVIDVDSHWEWISQAPAHDYKPRLSPDDLAYVIYTSGSSGKPKGVMLQHGSLTNYLLWAINYYPINAGCGAPVHSSLNFDLTITSLFPPLLVGGYVHLLSTTNEIEALGAALSERPGYSLVKLTPSHLQLLVEQLKDIDLDRAAHSLVIGGESLPTQTVRWWRERAADTRLFNEYGPTESVVGCSVYEVGAQIEVEKGRGAVPIGRPIANTSLYILDRWQQPTPQGVVGELGIGGEGLARGYLNQPDQTAERFVPHPYSEEKGARLYRTGDLARYLRNRQIEYLGRLDAQVKIRGYRIEPGEIEARLTSQAGVREAVVVAREEIGVGKRLVAYYTGEEVGAEALHAHLSSSLPEYMVPAAYIHLERVPLTPNGKVDRSALPEPDGGAYRRRGYEAPVGETETKLEPIWAETLKLDRVGRHENFFEIGGHSLLAMQVISRVRMAFGVEIGLRSIFEKPTVEGLARVIEQAMRTGERDAAPPLVRASREERLPLSFAQQRLWFIDQLEPGNAVYNCPGAVKLTGELNLEVLERVINEILRRHEVLRTRIEVEAGEPAQVIDEWEPRSLPVEDLTSLTMEERVAEASRMAREEAETGFDLSRGPLMRVKVLKLGAEEHVVLYTMHHIVSDAWSLGVLVREVCLLYEAMSEGKGSPLPELEIQYADYAKWQREYLSGEVLGREVGYWKGQLQGAAVMELPTDRARPAAPSHRGGWERIEIGDSLSKELRRVSQEEGATLFMTLMAAFKALMMRYSGEEDVSVGTAIANRTRREVEGLIGFFVNTLVMRTDLSGNPSFRELVKRERGVALGAYAHQEAPFEKLVEELNPERDLSRSPLFQVMMILQNAGGERLEVKGLRLSGVRGEVETGEEGQVAKFDLTVSVRDAGDGLEGVVNYSRDLYEVETIKRLIGHYRNVLDGIVKDRERPIGWLSLLSEGERKQIVEEWNETEATYGEERLIHELFEEQVERSPEAVALVCEEQRLTYGELNRRANRLAWRLRELGVGPEARVAICLERSLEMVVAMLATLKAGGAYAPLDPDYPAERLAYMLEDTAPVVLLTNGAARAALSAHTLGVCAVDLEADTSQWAAHSKANPDRAGAGLNARCLAYILYTSGSTGLPKGVAIEHRSVVNFICWAKSAFDAEALERTLFSTSINFDLAVYECFVPLAAGAATTIVGNALDLGRSPEEVTLVNTVPSAMRSLVETNGVPKSVRTVNLAGEPLRRELVEGIFEGTGVERVCNLYGPSETTTYSTWVAMKRGEAFAPHIGQPIANTRVYILDGGLEPSPVGVSGEIHIGGEGGARGYLNRPEMTAAAFLPEAFSREPGARVYKTGDLGRWLSGGAIEFLGRNDLQVKLRGYRIELGEIEARLRSHPGVSEAVVTSHEENESGKRLVAYYTGAEVTAETLRAYLSAGLPNYMVPAAYVRLEFLPLLPNGKLNRRALPAPDMRRTEEKNGYLAPRTPVEEIVTGIFRDVLKLNRVGIRENFFELGGHSLSATQVISRVRKAFEVEVGVKRMFEDATIEGLARAIEEAMRAGEHDGAPPLVRVSREERLPLSFAQQRLWFIDQLEPGNAVYNCPEAVKLTGELNLEVLERVINEILRRHEVLRTRIEVEAGEPAQVIDEWEPRTLPVEDLTSLTMEERVAEASRMAREEAETGFDLSRGPLMRVKVLKLGAEEHVVLYTMHHIVSDAWSLGVLVREVCLLYEAMSEGKDSPLPELEIQYADYAVWQRGYVAGEVLESEVRYWETRLEGAAVMELPADHARPAAPSYRGGQERVEIGKELSEGLKRLSQQEGATLFMVLMAAFKTLLMRYSGEEDVSVGTVIANRTRKEVEGLIGFFVNTLVMRTDLGGNPSFRELIKREREVALGAYAHQEAPFEKLVEEINPDRDLRRSPLFQVMMALQNIGREELKIRGLKITGMGEEAITAKFDLTLNLTEGAGGVAGFLEYSRDLYEGETIGRMARHYEQLVAEVVRDAEQKIREIGLMGEAEKRQVIEEWNATEDGAGEKARLLHEMIAERAASNSEAVAVAYGEERVSYGELNARANRLALYLRRLGVGPEVRVSICLERSVEMIVGLLGILKAGGAYVPLDPSYPAERLAYMLNDSGARLLLTKQTLLSRLPSRTPELVFLDVRMDIEQGCLIDLEQAGESESAAYIIYTSGSTGQPKGVVVPHRAVRNQLIWAEKAYQLSAADCVIHKTPVSFDPSILEIFLPLMVGAQIVIAKPDGERDIDYLLKIITEQRVTYLDLVPSLLQSLLLSPGIKSCDSLRIVVSGSEPLAPSLVEVFQETLKAKLCNAYGPTETTVQSTFAVCQPDGKRSVPIGRPVANTQLYMLDAALKPVPMGVAGEIHIGGAGVARGYLNRPELTAERFLPDLFGREPGARVYRTGDLGRWLLDGRIEFLGRNDFQVKIRGFRVELGEIEARLKDHPEVREAVVVAREAGEGGKRLVAYYIGAEVGAEVLRTHLTSSLPEHMAPVAYVRLEALPLTPNGKLDRRALPEPDGGAYVKRDYEAPVGETETKLAQIWAETLKLERVGRHDNFFELGGHSLLVLTVIERIRREGMRAEVRAFFIAPTLRALAATVERADLSGVKAPPNLIPEGRQRIRPEMLPLIELTQAEIEVIEAVTPGGAANIQDIYPLAPLQEGIFFHHLMSGEGDAYVLSNLLAFETRERLERFVEALQAVIDRHDILRTAVVWEGLPEPVQVVWREAQLKVEEVNLDPKDGQIARQLRGRFDPRRYRLDVRDAPLMRGFVAYDAAKDRLLLLLLSHHLTADHAALEIMMEEVKAHLSGEADLLPEAEPFRNFVAQTRLGVVGRGQEEHEAFFREMLGDVDEPTAPFGLTDTQRDGSGIEEARIELGSVLSSRLRESARRLGVSAASLCHLAWAVALSRVSGRDDVVFGTVLLGRMKGGEGADRSLGLFINTLPLRIRVNEEGVERSARGIHRLLGELIEHEHASLALAQRCSGVEAPAPLFSALLNYRHSMRRREAQAEATWKGIEIVDSEERTNYPVVLSVDDLGEGFALSAQTVNSIDPRRVCDYMRMALEGLVEALESAPDRKVREIEVMTEAERRLVMDEWNATEADYPGEKLVHELFEEQAEKNPGVIAVECEDERLNYGELNARANQLAHRLRELGVGPETLVGIAVERSPEMVIGLLGILKAGGAYVPIDPAYPPDRISWMLNDSAAPVIVTQGRLVERLREPRAHVVRLDDDWRAISERGVENPESRTRAENLAYVIYTSGSTGQPKGVMIEHRSVVNYLTWCSRYYEVEEGTGSVVHSSISFDLTVTSLWAPLVSGRRVVLVKEGREIEALSETLKWERNLSLVKLTPAHLKLLERQLSPEEASGRTRSFIIGGEALQPEHIAFWQKNAPETKLINEYGPTETVVGCCVYQTPGEIENRATIPIGRPIINTKLYILDTRLQAAPIGVVGELYIGGAGVGRGYLNRPDLTEERFIEIEVAESRVERVYKTGDMCRWLPDGNVEFVGRNDWQVKIRGYRIELGEIEARLMCHPQVGEAVVVVLEDGEGSRRLVAYYTGEEVGAEALRSYLATGLPDYMAPAAYVHLERLPLTPNGKLDRRALPAPAVRRAEEGDGYLAPRTPVEEVVVGIFEEVLKLDRVGRGENFFELGGHSLLAIQVVSRIRKVSGVEIGVRSVFEEGTVEGLARKIEEAMRAGEKVEAPPLVRMEREGARGKRLPLSFAQQRLWFTEQLEPGKAVYNIAGAVKLEGSLNVEALEGAINEIVRRHEVLRTRIEVEEGEPFQVIDEWELRRLEVENLSGMVVEERAREVERTMKEEAGKGFDLSRGPLLRVKILKLEEEEHVALFTMHHIISDGWSMGVLVRELCLFYEAMSKGRESPLPELDIQYADYASWQRNYLSGEALEEHLQYWRKQLGGKPQAVNLASDRPRPSVPSYRGAVKSLSLPAELYGPLKALSKREGATMFMVLLAAFKTLLQKYTAQDDILVGTSALNRNRVEVEPLIGFFVNMLPMKTNFGGNPRFREILRRVKMVALGAYAHQDLPFEKLVEEIQPERKLGQMPLFNIVFGVFNAPHEEMRLSGLNVSPVAGGEETARLDLSLWITEGAETVRAGWTYSTDLFEEETIVRMHGHFETLLSIIVAQPDVPLDQIEILSEAERIQQSASHIAREEYNYSRFKSVKPRAVALPED